MGLAAAQARLLSITSRMSDNELRAQLINNKKIRLANESARASEKYLNALNNAKLMFRNFDNENVEANQQLTFNALTAYGPYNTQYGLVNANGQMLVSEEMANAFEAANGDLEKFLKGFGLEKKSHFFNSIVNQYGQDETVMNVAKSLGAVNNDGTINDNLLIDTLENLYPAYLETIQSKDYQGYKANFDNVVNALTDYDRKVESQIKTELKSYYNTDSSVSLVTASNNYEKLNNYLTEINNTSGGWWNTTNLLTNSGVNYATMLTGTADEPKRLGTVFSGENYEFNANNAKDATAEEKYGTYFGIRTQAELKTEARDINDVKTQLGWDVPEDSPIGILMGFARDYLQSQGVENIPPYPHPLFDLTIRTYNESLLAYNESLCILPLEIEPNIFVDENEFKLYKYIPVIIPKAITIITQIIIKTIFFK